MPEPCFGGLSRDRIFAGNCIARTMNLSFPALFDLVNRALDQHDGEREWRTARCSTTFCRFCGRSGYVRRIPIASRQLQVASHTTLSRKGAELPQFMGDLETGLAREPKRKESLKRLSLLYLIR